MNRFFVLATVLMFSIAGCTKQPQPDITLEDKGAINQTLFADETQAYIAFSTNGAWNLYVSAWWLSVTPEHGNATGSYSVVVTLQQNYTGVDRLGIIEIKGGNTVIIATITQKATNKEGELYAPYFWKPKSDDVYVAGNVSIVATLWKNGAGLPLTDGNRQVEATSVFVSGGDVYVTGFMRRDRNDDYNRAVLWKNGVAQTLVDGDAAYSVFVSGNDVYVAGYNRLWKNGEVQKLPNGDDQPGGYSVYVSGSNVYVAGYESVERDRYVAKLWKNGVAQELADETGNAIARSVFVSGNDVYVAGYEIIEEYKYAVAKLWKNGVAQNLSNGNDLSSALSVFVVE